MNDLICHVAKVKAARSVHSMAAVIPVFSLFNIPFQSNASIKPKIAFSMYKPTDDVILERSNTFFASNRKF